MKKINDNLLKNINMKKRINQDLENLSYENITKFSKDINLLKDKKKQEFMVNAEQQINETENNQESIDTTDKNNINEDNRAEETEETKNTENDEIIESENAKNKTNNESSNKHITQNSATDKNKEKLIIIVNNKGYLISGINQYKEINPYLLEKEKQQNIEEKIYGDDYKEIISKMANKKVKKYYDPNLLKILYNKFGEEVAIQYLQELSKGKKANKDILPYEITYDIKNIKKNKDIKTKKQLKRMLKIARKNKNIATVIDDKTKKLKKGIVGLLATAVGITATSSTIGMLNEGQKNVEKNAISDTEVPGTITHDEKTDNSTIIAYEERESKEDNTSWSDSIKVDSNTTTNYAKKQIDDLIKSLESFKLGYSVSLEEGVNYTENSLGEGKQGETGVQYRPAGNYIVNGVSIINPSNNQIVTYSNMDLEANVVTISIPGEGKTIDKNFNLNEWLKSNLKEGMEVKFHIDKDGTKPTGWIDSSNIIKALEKSQEQQQDMNIDIRM